MERRTEIIYFIVTTNLGISSNFLYSIKYRGNK